MSEENKLGIFLIIIGIILIYISIKWIKKFKSENYNPFKDRKSVMKIDMYFKSYFGFITGIVAIILGILITLAMR